MKNAMVFIQSKARNFFMYIITSLNEMLEANKKLSKLNLGYKIIWQKLANDSRILGPLTGNS